MLKSCRIQFVAIELSFFSGTRGKVRWAFSENYFWALYRKMSRSVWSSVVLMGEYVF